MPSRNELNIRAAAVGLDPSTIANDSKLEQKVLFLEKNSYAVTGTVPTTTLTSSGVAGDGETFTIGSRVYTLKTALTGVIASGTLTSTGTIPNDGDIVLVGDIRYVFKTTLDTGSALTNFLGGSNNKFQVLINASAANALINLKKAINASGVAGTDYSAALTTASPYASAGAITSTTLVVNRLFAGSDAYLGSIVGTTVFNNGTATLSWGGAQLTGGVNPVANEILIGAAATNTLDNIKDALNRTVSVTTPDVGYSSPTKRHLQVTATTKTATTLLINSTDTNSSGLLATTETMANFAFTGATMGSGVAGMIAVADGTTVGTENTLAGVSGDANTTL